jgi:hypothetical protein
LEVSEFSTDYHPNNIDPAMSWEDSVPHQLAIFRLGDGWGLYITPENY